MAPKEGFSQSELIKLAQDKTAAKQFLEASSFYSRLYRENGESWSRVAQLENLRMAGALSKSDFKQSDSVKKFRETLGVEGAKHLVAQYIHSINSKTKLKNILENNKFSAPDEIEILGKKALRLKNYRDLLSTLKFVNGKVDLAIYIRVALLRRRTLIYLPRLKALNSKSPKPKIGVIRNPKTLTLRKAILTSGSEAIKINSKWVVDYATFPQAKFDNYTCDALLLGRSGLKIALRHEVTPTKTIKNVIFLAYPMTSSWGHWVIEVLTRMAQIDKSHDLQEYELLICEDVPQNFLDVTLGMFGKLNFTKVKTGESIWAENAIVQLATTHQKRRFFGSKKGGTNSYLDWRAFKQLREKLVSSANQLAAIDDSSPKNVYLDRTKSIYRKNESELEVATLAESAEYFAIDPGELSAQDELKLFSQVQKAVGFFGSQALFLFACQDLRHATFIYHDLLDEARSYSQMLKKVTGVTPNWISGARKNNSKIYSENSIHQGVTLTSQELDLLRKTIS